MIDSTLFNDWFNTFQLKLKWFIFKWRNWALRSKSLRIPDLYQIIRICHQIAWSFLQLLWRWHTALSLFLSRDKFQPFVWHLYLDLLITSIFISCKLALLKIIQIRSYLSEKSGFYTTEEKTQNFQLICSKTVERPTHFHTQRSLTANI